MHWFYYYCALLASFTATCACRRGFLRSFFLSIRFLRILAASDGAEAPQGFSAADDDAAVHDVDAAGERQKETRQLQFKLLLGFQFEFELSPHAQPQGQDSQRDDPEDALGEQSELAAAGLETQSLL